MQALQISVVSTDDGQSNAPLVKGRFLASNGIEGSCFVRMHSSDSAEIFSNKISQSFSEGHIITCYVDEIGPIAGFVDKIGCAYLSIKIQVSASRSARINARLNWLINRADETSEQRQNQRIVPLKNNVIVHISGIASINAKIIDLSMSGAALSASIRPDIGSLVTVGKRFANVVRHTDEGFAVSFRLPFSSATFNECVEV